MKEIERPSVSLVALSQNICPPPWIRWVLILVHIKRYWADQENGVFHLMVEFTVYNRETRFGR